jgi:hypothetical protein
MKTNSKSSVETIEKEGKVWLVIHDKDGRKEHLLSQSDVVFLVRTLANHLIVSTRKKV